LSSLTQIDPSVGKGIGHTPVWGLGLDGPKATLRLGATAAHTANGWQGTITWVVQAHAAGPIVMQGQLISDTYPPIWFQTPTQQASTEFVLNLSHPGPGSTSAFGRYPTTISVPQAGCYQITMQWYAGSWTSYVAIGQ